MRTNTVKFRCLIACLGTRGSIPPPSLTAAIGRPHRFTARTTKLRHDLPHLLPHLRLQGLIGAPPDLPFSHMPSASASAPDTDRLAPHGGKTSEVARQPKSTGTNRRRASAGRVGSAQMPYKSYNGAGVRLPARHLHRRGLDHLARSSVQWREALSNGILLKEFGCTSTPPGARAQTARTHKCIETQQDSCAKICRLRRCDTLGDRRRTAGLQATGNATRE